MRGPSHASSVLAARLLFTITLVSQYSYAADTTSVQDGDTFQAMAESAGIPVASLEAANPGVNADNLYAGQVINIPSNNGPAAATPMSESTAAAVFSISSPTASSATSSVSSTFSTSILPSSPTTILPSSTSTTPSSTSTTPSSTSTTPSSTSTTPSSTSTTPSSTSTIPSSTSTTPSPTPTVASPTTYPPVSPPAAPSCQPTPNGNYNDAADVQSKTNKWCSQVAATSEKQILASPNFQISGSSQQNSGHDGNQPNEGGYNMTITVSSPMCDVLGATAQYPLGSADTDDNCTTILYNAWSHCNNKGMGGSITAGCLIYAFEPDP